MDINSERLAILLEEIETYRRRKIKDDLQDNLIYIDPFNNKRKVKIPNNNILVGRRGSGKTTLILSVSKEKKDSSIIKYDCQHVRNYPANNIIIKLLLEVISITVNGIEEYKYKFDEEIGKLGILKRKNNDLKTKKLELEQLSEYLQTLYKIIENIYDVPEEITYTKYTTQVNTYINSEESSNQKSVSTSLRGGLAFDATIKKVGIKLDAMKQVLRDRIVSESIRSEEETSSEVNYEEIVKKTKTTMLDELVEPLALLISTYKKTTNKEVVLYLDDFYQIKIEKHVRLIHFLHNVYKQSSNSAFCFKICTLPNRIKLNNEDDVILSVKDDFSMVKLDRDLIDIQGLKEFLLRILCSLRKDLDIQVSDIESIFVNEESILNLVIASGGTPRDFLLMFRDAVDNVMIDGANKIGKTQIYSVVRAMREEKDEDIEYDVDITPEMIENALSIIEERIVKEKNTNVFLFPNSKREEYEGLLRNLVNARYLHLIKENVSSENQKKEQFSAYLIDMSFYISGKQLKREFNFRKFWEKDKGSRYKQVDSAPVFYFE
ncbi:hypothetical protein [Bacillus subtilis]|uniref:hypothetical protein n=1 Tax=Bacillus subtilis TaxID=1423 RepID=UPI00201CFF47|nr:hypothetical protein [Bacillus subtilis]MBK4205156.1 hypothetical protein [Bacillus subtilis]UQZ43245.1 hypothetical protein C2H91_10695 [Bacillus subtilis]